jgi:hypothetical protein
VLELEPPPQPASMLIPTINPGTKRQFEHFFNTGTSSPGRTNPFTSHRPWT